jgi:N-acetylmuramoyl-L-alanine amidase
MDIVEKRMKELGVDVKRGYRDEVGTPAMQHRVAEANAWGADLYYVAHTNAGGGRYTMTMCWDNEVSKAKAAVIGKYRKSIATHKVKARPDLYEIKATKMITLYDELFFHDNAEDCKWFHNGGMEIMAEETVQALCELLGVTYKAQNTNAVNVTELEAKVKALQSENSTLKNTIAQLNAKITAAKSALS